MKAGPRGTECDVFGAALGSNLRQEAPEPLCGSLHANVGPYFNHSTIAASQVLLKTPFTCHPTQYVIMRASLDALQVNLTFRWSCIVINSYKKNQLDALISQIYFWNKTLHVSDSYSVHHQDFFTIHTNGICHTAGSGRNCRSVLILLASWKQTCTTYTILVCTVKNYWWWTKELSETCRVFFPKIYLIN